MVEVDVRCLSALHHTLRLAASTPFYSARWGDEWRNVRQLADLQRLPTVSRDEISEAREAISTERNFPDEVSLTGGSTWRPGAKILLRETSRGEYEAFAALRRRLAEAEEGPTPLAIELISQLHGASMGSRPFTFRLPLERPNHFAAFVQLMERSFSYEGGSSRVRVVVGSRVHLQLLAVLIERAGVQVDDWDLRAVLSFGHFLSQRMRRNLSLAFRAPIYDVYGLTEVAGATCLECSACCGFHAPPTVIAEYLPVYADDVVQLAELCLTTLAPFQIRFPLIRYLTGDIVEILGACPQGGDRGFRVVGRLADSRHEGRNGSQFLLPSYLVDEVLSAVPDLSREPHAANGFFGLGSSPGSVAYDWVASKELCDGEDLGLVAPLHFQPVEQPDRAKRLESTLGDRLSSFARPGGRIAVRLTGPP